MADMSMSTLGAPVSQNIYAEAASERFRNLTAYDSVLIPAAAALSVSLNPNNGTLFYWGQGEQQNGWTTANGYGQGKPDWAVQGDIKQQRLEGGRIREVNGLGIQILPESPGNVDPRFFADASAILQRTLGYLQLQGQEQDCVGPLIDFPAGVGLAEGIGVFTSANTQQFATVSNGQAVATAVRFLPQPILIGATQQKIWLASTAAYVPSVACILRFRLLGAEKAPIAAG